MKRVFMVLVGIVIISCDSDDGTSTTGNTDEYFKYSINGVERIFDNDVEAHLETDSGTIIDRYEINANGVSSNGNFRRIGASFSFNSNNGFLPSTTYDWGLALDGDPVQKFYFSENTLGNLFILSPDFNQHPIVTNITSSIPVSIGDYIEFTFTGTFTDDSGNIQSITGECRAQRDLDQNF